MTGLLTVTVDGRGELLVVSASWPPPSGYITANLARHMRQLSMSSLRATWPIGATSWKAWELVVIGSCWGFWLRLHAVGDEGVPTRDIAGVIGRHLNLLVAWVPAGDLGFLGQILAIDQPASSALTRDLLGWRPVQPGLIDDLDKGHYFG